MKKLRLILAVIIISGSSLQSQDFHLSLYDSGPLFLNPALKGVVDATARIHAQYRNQWSSVAYKPFTTALISADMPKGKWGYGIQLINMRAGIGNYNAFQGLLSCGYTLPIDKEKSHNITFGLQAGITQKSIKEDQFTYDSQYSTKDGGYFDQDYQSNENFTRQSQTLPQLNAGLMYYYSKQQVWLNPFLGVSAFNLTQPKETFFDQANKLPMRINIHAGSRVNITEVLYVIPKVLVMMQGKAFEQTYALDAGYYLKQGKLYILAGYVFRAKDANIANIGVRKDNYILKFGYDFNTSTLKTATKTRGAMEIAFTYLFGKEKIEKVKHCPRL